jgi:hypothetical protein
MKKVGSGESLTARPVPNRLRKKYVPRRSLTAAAKADSENKPVIAAVNRCATQNQVQRRLLPRPAKGASDFLETYGIAEAMPSYET